MEPPEPAIGQKGLTAAAVVDACQKQQGCGGKGQRACKIGECRNCAAGLTETPGCTGDCRGSSGMCIDLGAEMQEPDVSWTPPAASPDAGALLGWADTHVHMFSYRGFGENVISGSAYDPQSGADGALSWRQDLGKHGPLHLGPSGWISFGSGDVAVGAAGTQIFNAWPMANSTVHQQTYWKWLERAWRGGLRLMTMLAVENRVACAFAGIRAIDPAGTALTNGIECSDTMKGVDAQLGAARAFEHWLDTQSGGPGKGWFRIVTSPQEAEGVIRDGKLAVVLGIEVDALFNCTKRPNDVARCTEPYVRQQVDKYYAAGVRHVYPTHGIDNAFGGASMFLGIYKTATSLTNGVPFATQECSADAGVPELQGLACNREGLSVRGKQLVAYLMDKGMLIDIDHMSSKGINDTIALARGHGGYPLFAGHVDFAALYASDQRNEKMRTLSQLRAIKDLGGVVSLFTVDGIERPEDDFCGDSTVSYANVIRYANETLGNYAFGSDFSGLAHHVGPRFGDNACAKNARQKAKQLQANKRLQYPFSLGPFGSFDRQTTGQRPFDFNTDGLAHIGLMPDFLADLRLQKNVDLDPIMHSANTYVTAWKKSLGAASTRLSEGLLAAEERVDSNGNVCSEPLTLCRGDCVDLLSNPRNCGGCGVSCESTQACVEGVCRLN